MVRCVSDMVKKESVMIHNSKVLTSTPENLKHLDMNGIHDNLCSLCPTTMDLISTICHRTKPRKMPTKKTRVVLALSVLMKEKSQLNNAIQKFISMILYNANLDTEVNVFT